jgi:hypothetical protein
VTTSDRLRLEKLTALQREAGISPDVERKELRTGPAAARREELARRPCWKIKRSRERGISA